MDLVSFRQAVDNCTDGIAACKGELSELYNYVGLPAGSSYTQSAVSDELYKKIKNSFSSGHLSVWRRCRRLKEELIQNQVIDGESLEPYFSVLERLQDAVRADPPHREEIVGDWKQSIRYARDHTVLQNWGDGSIREKTYRREFEVANAAKRVVHDGYKLNRKNGDIFFEPESESRLVAKLERLIVSMGGLNVAQRIFSQITPLYDETLERYHLVRRSSPIGEGSPQIPFGYLLLLAAKHPFGKKPLKNTDERWKQLLQLATDYAAVLNVQSYAPSAWASFDAKSLLPHLQELAVYDTLFCIPQIRGSDVVGLIRGLLDGLNFDSMHGSGWTINEVLAVVVSLLDLSRNRRGPISFNVQTIAKKCTGLPSEAIAKVLKEVLSHPTSGANKNFSKPFDAPVRGVPELEHSGHDFFLRPLLTNDGKSYFLVDRAMCAQACLEALFVPLRNDVKKFDDGQIGPATERFLRAEFLRRGIPTLTGNYRSSNEDGECDLVIETSQTVIFVEIKKKALTRRAKAGSDAHVLSDLAASLLKAQVQAGWHELRLMHEGFIEVDDNGVKTRLELKGRQTERIAVTLLDFGSFQDRIFLKQFLEGNLNAEYSVSDSALHKSFKELNESLAELRQQIAVLANGEKEIKQPFFNCWFLSVPQLLVLLDGVQGADAFKDSLWQTRHISTSSYDLYSDLAYMRKLKASVPPAIERQI